MLESLIQEINKTEKIDKDFIYLNIFFQVRKFITLLNFV